MQNPSETCECEGPGLCPRYQRHMVGRMLDICRGAAPGVSADEAAAYRRLWANQATAAPDGHAAAPPPARCRHLSKRVRDGEGRVKTVLCQAPG